MYTAANETEAFNALTEFAGSELGRSIPVDGGVIGGTRRCRCIPFLTFCADAAPHEFYTTNSIESLNYQLRKIIKNRGQIFSTDESVVKILWLAICDIEDKRARERDNERGTKRRKADGRLVQGQIVTNR